jgi:hypothetical protein
VFFVQLDIKAVDCENYDVKQNKSLCSLTQVNSAVEPGYKDIGLSYTSSKTSDVLWYQLIPH